MKRSQAFKSKYLRGSELDGELELIIRDVRMVQIDPNDDAPKVVVFFNDGSPLILNSGNWNIIEDMYGDDSDEWIGKKIRVWFNPDVEFQGKRVGGIRVRTQAEMPQGWSKSKLVEKAADVPDSQIPF